MLFLFDSVMENSSFLVFLILTAGSITVSSTILKRSGDRSLPCRKPPPERLFGDTSEVHVGFRASLYIARIWNFKYLILNYGIKGLRKVK